ncbi:NAD-dependent epimerase/dehydratase family protein [Streptomyces guryensis]|uniref:NAD-dependent epimerase/dehydratase family protein n=1 Tax=Streptomyces guryensis TaxID=2886947 RepID=UPI0027DF486D|nr:NAD-dependent epimerase/dehydratase family protein [Streptomyces guryensis]
MVPLLQSAGRGVRVLSRSARPAADGVEYVSADLLEGEGIEAAVSGTDTVLHPAGGQKGDDRRPATSYGRRRLRAYGTHDLTPTMAEKLTRLPVLPAPGGLRLQPVDSREVAARLVELTLGEPAGLVPDMAGPRLYDLPALVRPYLELRGRRPRPKLPVRIPGKAGRAYRAGENLTLVGAEVGKRTWEEFLAERL